MALILTGGYVALHPKLWPIFPHGTQARARAIFLFASLAVVSMAFAWAPEPGVFLDLRMAVVGFSGWLMGWGVSLPVAVIVSVIRLVIGGEGALGGVVNLVVAGIGGGFFYRKSHGWINYAAFGLVCACGTYLGRLAIGAAPTLDLLLPYALLLYPILSAVAVRALHWVFHEMQERVQLQESLQQELRLTREVLEAAPAGIVVADLNCDMIKLNSQASALLGIDEGALGTPLARWLPDEIWGELRHDDASVHFRAVLGGRVLLFHASRLPSGGGVISVQDVTHVVHEEQEAARWKRLEVASEYAAMAAHEVKNPLTTIKGFLQLLATRPELERYQGEMALIQGEVEQINRVVSDFLVLSRYVPSDYQMVDLADLFDELRRLTALQYPTATVEIVVEMEPNLAVWTDRKALRQILLNLFANAFDAMAGSGVLRVGAQSDHQVVFIQVVDTGPGIPSHLLPQIFLPYVTTKSTGTGLGLAICSKLIAQVEGEIAVESTEGVGTVFTLRLPGILHIRR